jgi:hypothetical protein
VAVEPERTAAGVRLGLDPKDPPAFGVKEPRLDQLVDPLPRLEGGVELDQRLGPEQPGVELVVHEHADPRIADADERPDVRAVVVDETPAELEDVHAAAAPEAAGSRDSMQLIERDPCW